MTGDKTTQLSTRALWTRVLVAIWLVSSVGVAAAQEGSASDADARYRSALKDALVEYDASHFEEARILFRRAHEINPNARTLRSIGMASFELRDYVAAVRALSAALVEMRKSLNAEQQTHAQGLLERSRMYVDVYTLKISPTDARVLIDGRSPDSEPDGTVLLGFGTHNLEASKPGFVLRTLVVNVRGGERKELAMNLERKPVAAAPPVAIQTGTSMSPSTASLPSGDGGHSGAGWFIAAGGTALVSAGAGALWLFQNKEFTSCHNPPSDQLRCNNESAILTKRNLAVGATLGTGVAAISLAVIGILTRDPTGPSPGNHSALSCTVLPSGFLCAKSF
jgi:tetratricopeptide (TPR) repeat protein